MKGDGEGKMNTVEKQCVVHGCSRPAIVGSSQSVTLPSRNFLFDFKNVTQFIHISPARDIVKRFSSGALPWSPMRTSGAEIATFAAARSEMTECCTSG